MSLFTGDEGKSALRPNGKLLTCSSCGLHRNAKTPRMKPFGEFKKGILNIGESPSQLDDDRGRPFQGPAGRMLKAMYEKFGVDLNRDCLNVNAVNCYPGDVLTTSHHTQCCYNNLRKLIEEKRPRVIMLFGLTPVISILGSQWNSIGGMNKWRGFQVPDRLHGAWVCPVFSPEYMEGMDKYPEVKMVWELDFAAALECLTRPRPYKVDDRQCVKILEDSQVGAVLERMLLNPPARLAFDYETTGKKPHAKGHQIVSCALSPSPMESYSFFMPRKKEVRGMLIRLLQMEEIGKIAANMKFEQAWSFVRLHGTIPSPWLWDTMQASHVLDNRPLITSLKFQAFIKMGVPDYAAEVKPYLESKDADNANAFNRILELVETNPEKLLMYGGLDALYEHRLALIQMQELGFQLPEQDCHWTTAAGVWSTPSGQEIR